VESCSSRAYYNFVREVPAFTDTWTFHSSMDVKLVVLRTTGMICNRNALFWLLSTSPVHTNAVRGSTCATRHVSHWEKRILFQRFMHAPACFYSSKPANKTAPFWESRNHVQRQMWASGKRVQQLVCLWLQTFARRAMVEDETGETCSTCGEDVKGQTNREDLDIGWKIILQDRQCTYNVTVRCLE